MAEVDFSYFKSATAWFETQTPETRSLMASRAALRVFANYRANMGGAPDALDLALLRCTLISARRAVGRPADMDWDSAALSAARSVTLSADSAALSAASAARSALSADSAADSAAVSADSAAVSADSAVHWDANHLASLSTEPVWRGADVPPAIAQNHAAILDAFRDVPKWAFWLKFYDGMWNGTFDEWDLALEVCKIDETIWEEGVEAVAAEIGKIEAGLLSEKTPLAEDIIFDQGIEKFSVVARPTENAPLIQTLIDRVKDNLGDAMSGNNGLREDEGFVRKLKRANARFQNDPQRLELDYTTAAKSIRRLFGSHELSKSEDNLDLLESVEDTVNALRANHPEIAANREQLAKIALAQVLDEHLPLLEDAAEALPQITLDVMSEDFAIDIPQLINDAMLPLPSGAPPLPGADETTRIFSRVSRMKALVDSGATKGAEIFDSKKFKTVRLGLTIAGLLSALVTFGLSIIIVL